MSDQKLPIPNIPGWPCSPIAEVSEFVARGTAPVYVESSDVLAIGQRCVTEAGFDSNFARPHDPRRMRGVLMPQPGDVFINSTGTGTIGRSCVYNSSDNFIVDGHITVVRPRQDRADGRWIEALVRSPWGQVFLEAQCYSGSTNQVELSRGRFSQTLIPLPDVMEQLRVGEFLDTADEAIRSTQQLIAKLNQAMRGLIHDLLTQDALSWRISNADSEFDIKSGITLGPGRAPRNHPVPYLRVANVQRGHIDDTDIAVLEASRSDSVDYALAAGDLLVVEGHASPWEIGRCAMVQEGQAGLLYQNHLFRLRSRKILPRFGLLWMNSVSVQNYWWRMCATSSGLNTINSRQLRVLPVPVPDDEEQARIVDVAEGISSRLSAEQRELDKLRLLKRGLMDDLLTGRVRMGASA
jgi:type I restriction enzyme S subunit